MCDNSNINKPLERILRQRVLCLIKVVLTLYSLFFLTSHNLFFLHACPPAALCHPAEVRHPRGHP